MANQFIADPIFRAGFSAAVDRIASNLAFAGGATPAGTSLGTGTSGAVSGQTGFRVQPGDIITAELINNILARLEALEAQPAPGPTPTVTLPTFTLPTFTTFPTLTFVPTFTLPTFTTIGPTLTFNPTFLPTFTTIGPTLTLNPTLLPTFTTIAPTLQPIGPTLVATLAPHLLGQTVQPVDTVRVVPGIGRTEEGLLAGAGIANIGALANADPTHVATTLNVQPSEAAGLVGIARGLMGPNR